LTFADASDQLDTTQPGKLPLGNQQVDPMLLKVIPGLLTRGGCLHVGITCFQKCSHDAPQAGAVGIDYQYPHFVFLLTKIRAGLQLKKSNMPVIRVQILERPPERRNRTRNDRSSPGPALHRTSRSDNERCTADRDRSPSHPSVTERS